MGMRFVKSGINHFLAHYVGKRSRPTFFSIDTTCPSLNRITENFAIIRSEFDQAYARTNRMPRYHEIDPGEKAISDTTAGNWNVFMLYLLGHRPEEASRMCPRTSELLAETPNLVQAFFSILDPGKSIPPHHGPYLGYLRYHLGLRIPTADPPRIIVNGRHYHWREGEAVLFDDTWLHEVVNKSRETRAVLIVDVLRPLPPFPHSVNSFCTNVIAKHTYGRHVMKKLRQHATTDRPFIE